MAEDNMLPAAVFDYSGHRGYAGHKGYFHDR